MDIRLFALGSLIIWIIIGIQCTQNKTVPKRYTYVLLTVGLLSTVFLTLFLWKRLT